MPAWVMVTTSHLSCSMSARNHKDIKSFHPTSSSSRSLAVAEHRHRRGLMYPYIYHVLTKVREHIDTYLLLYTVLQLHRTVGYQRKVLSLYLKGDQRRPSVLWPFMCQGSLGRWTDQQKMGLCRK